MSGKNLFDNDGTYTDWSEGYLKANGDPSGALGSAKERTTPFIPIIGGQTYVFSFASTADLPSGGEWSNNICFYDSSKALVGTRSNQYSYKYISATAPSNASYVRVSLRTYDITEKYQLEFGSTVPSTYTPYRAPSTASVQFGAVGKNICNPDAPVETFDLSGQGAYRYGQSFSGGIKYGIVNTSGSTIYYRMPKADLSDLGTTASISPNASNTPTVPSDCVMWVFVQSSSGWTSIVENIGVNRDGSTTFEPYTNQCYGGTADVVAGTGSEEWVYVNANDVSWSNTGDEGIYTTFSDKKMSTQTAISDTFNARTYSTSNRVGWTESTPTRAEKLAIIANGNVHIAYKLSTPTDYTFPPASEQLTLAKGTNNAWAEMTNTETT